MKTNESPAKAQEWRGYTLNELRDQRDIALAHIKIEKSKLIDASVTTRNELPFIGRKCAFSLLRSIYKIEYLIIAIKLFRKFAPLFKKK